MSARTNARLPRMLWVGIMTLTMGCGATEPADPMDPDPPVPTECEAPETSCDGQCVDLSTDAGHCGVCGRACESGLSCEAGQCMTPVPACELDGAMATMDAPALCNGACVDLDSDVSHCGRCGDACPVGEACVGGSCAGPPPFGECEAQVQGTLKTSLSDIALTNATVTNTSLRHAFDIDEVDSQGCVDRFEAQARLSGSGCTLSLVFAADEAGAGLVYAGLDVDSFCPGFDDTQEGLYERTDGWGPTWFGLDKIADAAASQTCVAGQALSFDSEPLRLLRSDGAQLTIDLSQLDLSGWVPSEQDTSASCVDGPTCGQARDGGDGWCLLSGCSPDHHEGGDEICTPIGVCRPGFLIFRGACSDYHSELFLPGDFEGRVSPALALGPCSQPGACSPEISMLADANGFDRQLVYLTQTPDAWNVEANEEIASRYTFDAAVDSQGNFHFCQGFFADGEHTVSHVLRTPNGWESTELGQALGSRDCAIAIGPDDYAHVVYLDDVAAGIVHMRQTAGGWIRQAEEPGPEFGSSQPALDIDADGVAHMIYVTLHDGPQVLRYARSGPEGFESSTVFEGSVPFGISFGVDADGIPHMVYGDGDLRRIEHGWLTPNGWSFEIIDGSDRFRGTRPILTFDNESKLHVIYSDNQLAYAYQTSAPGGELQWAHHRFQGSFDPEAFALDDNGDLHVVSHKDADLLRYTMVAGSHRCPEGEHDGGDGACVPIGTCSEDYWDGGAGHCATKPLCIAGFHDGGDGSVCLPLDECVPGYHDGGPMRCLPIGECSDRYRDGGDGVCVRDFLCSPGSHDGGDGSVCLPSGVCLPGYHDGGEDTCTLIGECIELFHDGGDGVCVPRNECSPGYHNGGVFTCLPIGECIEGYHDSGPGVCVPISNGCALGYHDGGDGVCLLDGECSLGFHDGGGGYCVPEGECVGGYRDRGDGVCVRNSDPCLPGFHDGGLRDCVPIGTCVDGYHDGGDGACVAVDDCSTDFHDRGDGVCAPLDECLPGFISEGTGDCARALYKRAYGGNTWQEFHLDSQGLLHAGGLNRFTGEVHYGRQTENGLWAWETVGFGATDDRHTSFALDPDDNPHFAYYNGNLGRAVHATKDSVSGQWNLTTLQSGGQIGLWSSIAVDAGGDLHVCYYDGENIALRYAYFSMGQWTTVTLPDPLANSGSYLSVAIDSEGWPHIIYNVQHIGIRYAYLDDEGWHFETVSPLTTSQFAVGFAVGSDGVAHILFVEDRNLRYATRPPGPASQWTVATVDTEVGFSLGLGLDAQNRPHIVYDGDGWTYATFDGTNWLSVVVAGSELQSIYEISVAVDGSGFPHLGFAGGYLLVVPLL